MIEARPARSQPGTARPDGRRATVRLRVLIVEDHPLVRAAIRQAITTRDLHVVAEVGTAREALPVALETRPDVILLDIDLPGSSGLSIVRPLADALPDAAIVMLTVSDADEDVLEALKSGAAGYLQKGIGARALQRAVRGAVRGDLSMSRTSARRVIRGLTGRDPLPTRPRILDRLTSRELEVLRLLADGLTARQVATALGISTRTAEGHVAEILRRLGARNRAEAVRRYVEGS
jgi:DNA-binding NarL/FixJ family response regulator